MRLGYEAYPSLATPRKLPSEQLVSDWQSWLRGIDAESPL